MTDALPDAGVKDEGLRAAQNGGPPASGQSGTEPLTESSDSMTLKREFTFGSTFALAFAFISPIVALYTIFALGFQSAGPAMWWAFLVVAMGQGLVALVFAQMASIWPLEGAVYQWSRRAIGNAYGWFAGWAYMWTLLLAISAVCFGGATFLAPIIGIDSPSSTTLVLLGGVILAFATVCNTIGRGAMKLIVALSITAEVIGSVGIGLYLLIFHRENSLSILFEGIDGVSGWDALFSAGFVGALAFVGWSFVGFESAGAISEEVINPERNVPRAILTSLFLIAVVVMLSALGVILAIPDLGAVMSGAVADPITETLQVSLGAGITKPLFAMFVIGFSAAVVALEAGCSRVMFSFARDRALPGSTWLSRLSDNDKLPINAIFVCVVLSAGLLALALAPDVYATLIAFTSGGFYIAFLFPAIAALALHIRGGWASGPFSIGRWSFPVNVAAVVWLLLQIVNIAWPRTPDLPWYQNYGVVFMAVILGSIGLMIYGSLRHNMVRHDRIEMR